MQQRLHYDRECYYSSLAVQRNVCDTRPSICHSPTKTHARIPSPPNSHKQNTYRIETGSQSRYPN